LTERKADSSTEQAGLPEEEEIEDLGSFGLLRGSKERAVSLELRKKDGNIPALPYHCIEYFDFDPSVGMTIHALGREFKISGHNLNAMVRPHITLFNCLVRQRVPWKCEASHDRHFRNAEDAVYIRAITW
jgi:hypothetical protein